MPLLSPQQGTLHSYEYNLTAFEFGSRQSDKAVIFIGGLGNKYLSVPYLSKLNESIGEEWRLFQIDMSSSGEGWGTGSLDRDADEIELLVKYLKSININKIILFGHSTGCQDSFHYLLEKGYGIEGIILQAPVSDREATVRFFEEENFGDLNDFIDEAKQVYKKDPLQVLPRKYSNILFGAPINAYRWLSLTDINGDDDYFSSDLSDEKLKATFGKINKPALFLYSGNDFAVPQSVNKSDLLQRWSSFTNQEFFNSSIIEGASHDVGPDSANEQEAVNDLLKHVLKFLSKF